MKLKTEIEKFETVCETKDCESIPTFEYLQQKKNVIILSLSCRHCGWIKKFEFEVRSK